MSILDIQTPRVFVPALQPARYKGLYGGRASAKSNFVADYVIEKAICEKIDIVCLREVQKSLEFSVKKLLETKISTFNAGSYFDVQDRRILTKNGGVIIFEGMQAHTSDSIKSLEGFSLAWCEEAQTLSQKSLDILRPTIRKPNSEIIFTWNPHKPTDPVDKFLRSEKPFPDSIVIGSTYLDNPFCPQIMLEEAEYDRARDYDKYEHVWLGSYEKNSEARVFKNWTVEEFEAPPNTVFRLGADFGFAADPTVLVRCYVEGNTLYIDHESYGLHVEIINLPQLFSKVPDANKWLITGDSSRPETISHLRNHGYPQITGAKKGAGSVQEGIAFLKSFNIVVHPRCVHTIGELTHFKHKVDKLTGQILSDLEDNGNHVIDACMYATEALRKANYKPFTALKVPSL